MKKVIPAIWMAVLACAVIWLWRGYRNAAPALEDIYTLDLSRYPVTYEIQEFRLKPHDRQWTLKSFTVYDKNGNVTTEQRFQLDEDGQSYYIASNGNRIDSLRMPRLYFQNITEYLSGWDIVQESFDNAGRIVYREAAMLHSRELISRELIRWYYCTDQPERSDDSAICTFVRTMRIETPRDEPPQMFYGYEQEPRWESTAYEITSYDCFGNETTVWVDDDCYIKTDADGYPQMFVVVPGGGLGYVERVDAYGRPLWQARYDKSGDLLGWSVWEYQELE